MPEGDTVFRAARLLDRALQGSVLTRTDLRVPQHATADLSGGLVVGTVSRGKHLLTRITRDDEAWTLHTHLKMEGAWRVFTAGQRWKRPAHQARVVLEAGTTSAVGFSLGIVELIATADEPDVVGHLGPDLLGPDWDEAEALRRLGADPEHPIGEAPLDQRILAGAGMQGNSVSGSVRSIGEALLDQRNLAGIGNMWMAETLFLTGVNPATKVPDVPDLSKIVRMAYRLLQANKERAVQATTGSTRRGEERYVYGRRGKACRRCGTRIQSDQLGPLGRERVTFWCPRCQA
ncbi:DNA-formamidopyrimidine glycosylase family protein [Nocardioides sp.]|uniref:DNA-formamidopyrimidine glycosylase family protein n=1 Tax=Nocardioides sp. TaxID=35761 RepID=UPI00286B3733|nr:DNA-formamidopyrimidine glycosylase family protein [Nocardioides sp.]